MLPQVAALMDRDDRARASREQDWTVIAKDLLGK